MQLRLILIFSFLVIFQNISTAKWLDTLETNSQNCDNKKLLVIGSEVVLGTTALYYLNNLWYKDYPRSSFHFFNDNNQWFQMDKMGHLSSSYLLSHTIYRTTKLYDSEQKKALLYSSLWGTLFMNSIEILDGFSSNWGASYGDIIANSLGTSLHVFQVLIWNEERVKLNFSYFPSNFAKYRPETLGDNHITRLFKDYNAQTYWVNLNLSSFSQNSFFPKWLELSFGYSANGMLGGSENPDYNGKGELLPITERHRQYFFSFDLNLEAIKTKSKILKETLHWLNFIKIPLPTLEFSQQKIQFHLLYF